MSSWGAPRSRNGMVNYVGQPSVPIPVQNPVPSSGYKLGGSHGSQEEARRAQQRSNEAKVTLHKEQEWEKRKKKLEDKLERDPALKAATSPGYRLGQAAHESGTWGTSNSRQLNRDETEEAKMEIRRNQQERYNASVKKTTL